MAGKIVVIRDMSAGNESVGEMWQETKIFDDTTPVGEVMDWGTGQFGLTDHDKEVIGSSKRITITRPHK